jgi:hypothetical protein
MVDPPNWQTNFRCPTKNEKTFGLPIAIVWTIGHSSFGFVCHPVECTSSIGDDVSSTFINEFFEFDLKKLDFSKLAFDFLLVY